MNLRLTTSQLFTLCLALEELKKCLGCNALDLPQAEHSEQTRNVAALTAKIDAATRPGFVEQTHEMLIDFAAPENKEPK